MIKLKYCYYLIVLGFTLIGTWVGVLCIYQPDAYPFWFHVLGMVLFFTPLLFVVLANKTHQDIINWCDRYDQEREDERFFRSKK